MAEFEPLIDLLAKIPIVQIKAVSLVNKKISEQGVSNPKFFINLFDELENFEDLIDPQYKEQAKDSAKNQIIVNSLKNDNTNFSGTFFVVSSEKSYFHNEPDSSTQRKGYLIVGQRFLGKEIKNGFVYAEYTNTSGILTNGWIKFSDVRKE
jgi:hypothetical protein